MRGVKLMLHVTKEWAGLMAGEVGAVLLFGAGVVMKREIGWHQMLQEVTINI